MNSVPAFPGAACGPTLTHPGLTLPTNLVAGDGNVFRVGDIQISTERRHLCISQCAALIDRATFDPELCYLGMAVKMLAYTIANRVGASRTVS
jgi:hypothetical protein